MEISLENISHRLGNNVLFNELYLEVNNGECCVISGDSGSGKSFLFNMICDISRPQQGEVVFDGIEISKMNESQYFNYKKHTGVIFQLPALISNLTLKENLLLPLNRFFPDESYEKKISMVENKCIEIGLENYLDLRTEHLSIGMASLVGVIRAALLQPKVIVWDSPISEVDSHWTDYEINLIKDLKERGVTQILLSNRKIIERLGHHVYRLEKGQCYAA